MENVLWINQDHTGRKVPHCLTHVRPKRAEFRNREHNYALLDTENCVVVGSIFKYVQ